MFLDCYGLNEQPFGDTPDPRYLYLGRSHREALASLFYGIEVGRGFQALIAEPGMGKTTLLFEIQERLRNSARTAFLFQTQCNSREFLRYLLHDLGLDIQGQDQDQDIVAIHSKLNEILARETCAGRRFVLIIDEAQNLEDSVLETIRLLSDFETARTKLLQIILAGQPQLAKKLGRPGLAPLRQRIAVLVRLDRLNPPEATCYIEHRLKVAGYNGDTVFSPDALAQIARRSQGIPRVINNICFAALSLAYASKRSKIDSTILDEVMADLDLDSLAREAHTPELPVPPTLPATSQRLYSRIGGIGFGLMFLVGAVTVAIIILSVFLYTSAGRTRRATADPLASGAVRGTVASSDSQAPALQTGPTPFAANQPPHSTALERNAHQDRSRESFTIVVEPMQTLRQISLRYLGRFNSHLVEEIRELNGGMTDPNHIQIGQRLRLPGRPRASDGRSFAAEPMDRFKPVLAEK